MENSTLLGPLCAFGSSVTWAVGSAGYSRLSRGHSAFAVNFARALVALPLFAASMLIVSGGPASAWSRVTAIEPRLLGWLGISMFASYGLGDVLFMWSTRSLGVPSALAIGSTFPLLTAGVGAWVQGEPLGPRQLIGLAVTVFGVITVILSGAAPTPPSFEGAPSAPGRLESRGVGLALAFATMTMWALNSVATSRSGKLVDPFTANAVRMLFALGMSAGFSRLLAPGTELTIPLRVVRKSLPLFFIEAFGGSLLFMYGLSHSPLSVGPTLASLAPVLAVPVAWGLGLEKFSLARTSGVCLVVGGLWLLIGAV